MKIELTSKQQDILEARGHLLVQGGPGSGKTTVSILKAARIVNEELSSNRRVLFLSFARATVSRVLEAIDRERALALEIKRRIEVDTYHAFFWRLIKTNGYLLGLPRHVEILTPSSEAIALSEIRNEYKANHKLSKDEREEKNQREFEERRRLAIEEGLVCFDLFGSLAGQLLHGSRKICALVSNAYPVIILDEFQDTAPSQWNVIKALGRESVLIALADPEQRIFDFIGADPKRLEHFRDEFGCKEFDLSDENHRSKGTDLLLFGNDILRGKFSKKNYDGLILKAFEPNPNQALAKIKIETLEARARLIKDGPSGWSLAILVPTKSMTRRVSDAFRSEKGTLPRIAHYAAVDTEGAILAAEVIAYLLQCNQGHGDPGTLIDLICSYYRGKGGGDPTKTALIEASRTRSAYEKATTRLGTGKTVAKTSIFLPISDTFHAARDLTLVGIPDHDWRALRDFLDKAESKHLNEIGAEVRNIRLLERGTQLREALSQNWRDKGRYVDALKIVREAFVQEHFSSNLKPETGVVIMNMHKAKGKQFDEVIIFEGWPIRRGNKIVGNPDRIVRGNVLENDGMQTRQCFRVGVTRAKHRTTILTPSGDPCILLKPKSG